jgi:hypothetical protein
MTQILKTLNFNVFTLKTNLQPHHSGLHIVFNFQYPYSKLPPVKFVYFQLLLGTCVSQTHVIWRRFKRRNGFLLLKSQWLVTLCISHLLQAARMEQWENQTSRLRNLACYKCIEHRKQSFIIYLSLWTNSIRLSLFWGSIVVIKKSSATHRKEFCEKIAPKLMRGKNITFNLSHLENRFSSSTKYSRILNFFYFPLWPAAKFD